MSFILVSWRMRQRRTAVRLLGIREGRGEIVLGWLALSLVLGSGFLHSMWNLYTKKSQDKNLYLWLCQIVSLVVFFPWAWASMVGQPPIDSAAYPYLLASALLHGLYIVLLAATYSIGDLSQVYPIMRGTSPLLVPLIAVLALGERLTAAGWAGVLLIVGGICLLSDFRFRRGPGGPRQSLRPVLLAFAVGLCIACYITVDKMALAYMNPLVLNQTTIISNFLALSLLVRKKQGIAAEWKLNWRLNWKPIVIGGIIAPGGYMLFLFALTLAPVSQLAPMREIGTVFGTLMGVLLLKEQQGQKRFVASIIITIGIIVLGISG